ncbi:MAG TPA: hypothetical protein VFA66_13230 [Gaiellaceae bacterium]|nr:hypothetical protein [Gaiellaceae bacterium]
MSRASPLAREAALVTGAAALVATILVWAGPPGSDLAAHLYQRTLFIHHGFVFWNNFWYAGRYTFVTYSLLYYPLAALLGIRLLAVATVATAALAFAVVLWREFGPASRWSSRTFAVVWAGLVLSAAFPFALGMALALLALWALQAGRRWRFAGLAVLTALASAISFVLLLLVVVGVTIARRPGWRGHGVVAASLVAVAAAEALLWRAFPTAGRYPFSAAELAAVLAFCVISALACWRVDAASTLRWLFPVYGAACLAAYLIPSALGENIARLRFAAVPLGVLILTLRRWRPSILVLALALAAAWNVSPLAANFVQGAGDPAARAGYWRAAIAFLHRHLSPSYRVEAVDTAGHWPALYLPRAGIPLARGWFRQDDAPENSVLYDEFGPRAYLAWLRELGVRYVVLTTAPPDYSARAEAALLRGPRSPLPVAYRAAHLTIYAVPAPAPIVSGPGRARVLAVTPERLVVKLFAAGTYRVAVRYSPYLHPSAGCLAEGPHGLVRLRVARAGIVRIGFGVDVRRALAALTDDDAHACAG